MTEHFLELKNVHYAVDGREILRNVSLNIPYGCGITLVGKNNSGKSSLLKLCEGQANPSEGEILLKGASMAGLSYIQLQDYHRSAGTVFEGGALINNLTVYDNVALPLKYHERLPQAEMHSRVQAQLACMQIEQYAGQLPAGVPAEVKVRASFARAFIANPQILFLDEPFALLEPHMLKFILVILKKLKHDGKTVILAAMNTSSFLAAPFYKEIADEVLIINNNTISERGKPEDIRNKLLADDFSFNV